MEEAPLVMATQPGAEGPAWPPADSVAYFGWPRTSTAEAAAAAATAVALAVPCGDGICLRPNHPPAGVVRKPPSSCRRRSSVQTGGDTRLVRGTQGGGRGARDVLKGDGLSHQGACAPAGSRGASVAGHLHNVGPVNTCTFAGMCLALVVRHRTAALNVRKQQDVENEERGLKGGRRGAAADAAPGPRLRRAASSVCEGSTPLTSLRNGGSAPVFNSPLSKASG